MAGSQESLRHAEVVVADHDACEHVQLLRALGDMTLSRPLDPADHATALLALLLSQPLQASAWPVAVGLIGAFGSVSAVFAAQRTQLAAVVGMTEAAVNLLQTMRVALCWAAEEALRTRDLIASAQDVRRYLQATMRGGATEIAHGLFLDRKNHLLRDVVLAIGTVDYIPLEPREVVRQAIELGACALILYHNHPSGDPEPSLADIETTRKIAAALATVNVALHDHFIVGHNDIISLRARRCF